MDAMNPSLKRMRAALLATLTCTGLLFATSAATANENSTPHSVGNPEVLTAREKSDLVDGFAARVKKNFNFDINRSDYKITSDPSGVFISHKVFQSPQHKGSAPVSSLGNSTKGTAAPNATRTEGGATIPSSVLTQMSPQVNRGATNGAKPAQEPQWAAPYCYARYNFNTPFTVAWLDMCTQFARVDYAGQPAGRVNFMNKTWTSCSSIDDRFATTKCGVGIAATAGRDHLSWLGWEPKSDINLGDRCEGRSFGVGLGPVSGSISFNVCEQLKIVKNNSPLEFHSDWFGKAVKSTREAGFIGTWSIREGGDAGLYLMYGIDVGACVKGGLNNCVYTIPVKPV
jgi:hypothetical protein